MASCWASGLGSSFSVKLPDAVADQIAVLIIGQNFARDQVIHGGGTASGAGGKERNDHALPPVRAENALPRPVPTAVR